MLLDKVSQAAARRGASKLFVRLTRDDPMATIARRSGFFRCVREALYKGSAKATDSSRQAASAGVSETFRSRSRADDFPLFRLYNAATPSETRKVVGMTFDAWMASLEGGPGVRREFVLEIDGVVSGWIRVSRWFRVAMLEVTVHPERRSSLEMMADFALQNVGSAKTVCWLVPEHQVALRGILEDTGLDVAHEYITLVKSMAIRAEDNALTRAGIAAT